jgi:hypothetical protein
MVFFVTPLAENFLFTISLYFSGVLKKNYFSSKPRELLGLKSEELDCVFE